MKQIRFTLQSRKGQRPFLVAVFLALTLLVASVLFWRGGGVQTAVADTPTQSERLALISERTGMVASETPLASDCTYDDAEAVYLCWPPASVEVFERDPIAAARVRQMLGTVGLLLIPDSTNDRVMAFDPITGNLIDANFIPSNPVVGTGIHAILSASGNSILLSDQIGDVVHEFDLSDGSYIGIFAPAGGPNTAILDNIRGISLDADGNLLVTVASGANTNSVAKFDTSGNFLGNFIPAASGGLGSPWHPYGRGSDWLVSGSGGTTGILRYDLTGAFLNVFAPISTFPEQIAEAANGNVLVANFSPTSNEGVLEYTATGTFVGRYDPGTLSGYRGVYELPGGTILTTTGTGVHEIDRGNNFIESKITGVSGRFIEYIPPQTPVTFACNAPAEGFEGSDLPAGWTVQTAEPAGPQWGTLTACGEGGNYTNGTGGAACVSSDLFGTAEMDTSLVTPMFDLTGYTTAELTYTANYQNFANFDFLDVDISTDGGATWTTLLSWNEDHGAFRAQPGEDVTVDLSAYAGQSGLMLRWRYYDPNTGDWNWYAQIDDVALTCDTVGGDARLAVAHLAPFAMDPGTAVTITLNATPVLTNFAYGDSTAYLTVPAGSYNVDVYPAGSATPAISGSFTLTAGVDYSVIAIGDGANQPLALLALVDDNSAPAAGNFKLRLGHLAPFASGPATADIRQQDGTPVLLNVNFSDVAPYLELPAGTYDLKVTTPGGGVTLIDPLPVTLPAGAIVSAFAAGDGSNQPLGAFAWPTDDIGFFLPLAPVIEVDPTEVSSTQLADTQVTQTLTINNVGAGDLVWNAYTWQTAVSPEFAPAAAGQNGQRGAGSAASGAPDNSYVLGGSFSEGFDDITNLPGWFAQNNSSPLGLTNWFQGNDAVFPAHAGAPTSYIGANFNNTSGVGTISNWLLTPELSLADGDTFSFWTRTATGSSWPDRLELRLSLAGASTNVGTLATDVGDFTTLLLSVNPALTLGGYPEVWTQYTVTLSGIPSGASGRFGFRYFVTNGGPSGANSNYIGIDSVEYVSAAPTTCSAPVDIPWVTIAPSGGTLAGGESVDLDVTFDSTGLATGVYTGTLCITSNDPVTPLVEVPLTLTVAEPSYLRVAHLAPFAADASVTVTLNGAPALSDFNYGDSTTYLTLPAGTYDVAVFPTGSGTPAITATVTLDPDTYYSAVATGDGANQPLALLALVDDNTAPAAGFFHLRLGHLAPFASGAALADIRLQDGTPVLTNVAYGDVTGYIPLPAGTYDLKITTPGGGTTLIDPLPVTLPEGALVTAFATGEGSNQDLGAFAWLVDEEGFFLPLTTYGVALSPATAAQSGAPGEVVTYTLTVTNTGNVTDTFTIALSGNSWTSSGPASITLGAGASGTIVVTVAIPASAADNDSDSVTVTVTSAGDGTVTASSELTTTAVVTGYVLYLPLIIKP